MVRDAFSDTPPPKGKAGGMVRVFALAVIVVLVILGLTAAGVFNEPAEVAPTEQTQ